MGYRKESSRNYTNNTKSVNNENFDKDKMKTEDKNKIRRKKQSKKKYNTLSITMELKKPLDLNMQINDTVPKEQAKVLEKRNKFIKNVSRLLIAVVAICLLFFVIWLHIPYKVESEALLYMESDSKVKVEESAKEHIISFSPVDKDIKSGVIIFPETKVSTESYAKLAKKISEEGYKVIVCPLTFNSSHFTSSKVTKILEENENIKSWAFIGHSKGGEVAAYIASKNVAKVNKIIMLAAYPVGDDIEFSFAKVLSIWGTNDGIMNYENFVRAKDMLPKDTEYVQIEGGNHSQFAEYETQKGDNKAIISKEKQFDITIESILNFLKKDNRI